MSDLIRREDARLIALEYISDSMERHGALEAISAIPAVQPGHVNETPKSEHDERVMLTLTAERDRFRKVLKGLMAHEPDYSDTLWQDARAALKGETP